VVDATVIKQQWQTLIHRIRDQLALPAVSTSVKEAA